MCIRDRNTFKILAGYHQYFAVKKAIESTKHATVTDGKGGVFWHTQGSGKSLSMVFYAPVSYTHLDVYKRQDVLNTISGYKLPVITLDKSTPREAVCKVFENVNTGGVPLTCLLYTSRCV